MYQAADKAIKLLNKHLVLRFGALKSLLNYDELNVLNRVNELFEDVIELYKQALLQVARSAYRQAMLDSVHKRLTAEDAAEEIDEAWLMIFLNEYDPVTEYKQLSELDRKRSRCVETLIAAENKNDAIERAKRILSRHLTQGCIEITDRGAMQAYKDAGVEKVVWETEKDDRVCLTCERREGHVYPITRVPDKPHYNCRCWLRPFVEGENIWTL